MSILGFVVGSSVLDRVSVLYGAWSAAVRVL